MQVNLFLAFMFCIAGLFTGLRHIMSSPRRSAFPQCPPAIRFMMFAKACSYAGLGSLLYTQRDAIVIAAPSIAILFVIVSSILALYEAVTFFSYLDIIPMLIFSRGNIRDFHVHTSTDMTRGTVVTFPESEKVLKIRRTGRKV